MITLTILVFLILVAEVTRLFLTHRKTTKKAHFKQKLDSVEKMMWDLEFKAFKTSEIREDVRKEYDNKKSRLFAIEEQIKSLPQDRSKWTDEQKRLEDDITLLKRDLERHEAQMEALDAEIHGAKKSEKFPEGYDGVDQQLESFHELTLMLKDWIKKV